MICRVCERVVLRNARPQEIYRRDCCYPLLIVQREKYPQGKQGWELPVLVCERFADPYEVLEKCAVLKVWQQLQPLNRNAFVYMVETPLLNLLSQRGDSNPSRTDFFFAVAVLERGSQNCSFCGTTDRFALKSGVMRVPEK